jgi:uncharacterized membrane protein
MAAAPNDALVSPSEARRVALERGYSAAAARRAAALAAGSPPPEAWTRLLTLAAGGVGAGLLASALVTFFAANWDHMGRVARLGVLELALVAAALVAARWFGRLAARLALDLGFVAVGALLAVFGQTYQTGADPYELFLGWAALGAPWVLVAGADELWLLFTLVLGFGLARFLDVRVVSVNDTLPMCALALWALGALAIALWEAQARRPWPWLRARWLPRAWASLAGAALCLAFVVGLFDRGSHGFWVAAAAVAASLAATARAYWRRTIELYMQTVMLGVLIVAATSLVIRALSDARGDNGDLELLAITVVVIAQTAGAAVWLRRETRRARGGIS